MPFELDRAIQILERTPRTLHALLEGLGEEWVSCDEGPDTFSARDVVGHLLSGEEEDWVRRTQVILRDGPSTVFETFDRFKFKDLYGSDSMETLLARFAELRAENLATIRSLDLHSEQLELHGTHPQLGTVTLRELLATWTVHDLGHIRQIVRVMAKQYRDDVGPWKAYLRVLDE